MSWLRGRIKSIGYALDGIFELFRSQPNAKIHLFATVLVSMAGFYFKISSMEWIAITLCITLVIAAEAFNTALEYLTDLASPDIHPLAKKTKDVAAAAVFITAMGAVIVGLIVFLPKIFQ